MNMKMLWNTKKEEANLGANLVNEIVLQTIKQPIPKLIPQTLPLDEYVEVSKQIGFMPAKLLEAQILNFLSEQKISVFDDARESVVSLVKTEDQV